MGKPCRLSFMAYRDNDLSLTFGDAFEVSDLLNGIEYCQWLIAEGWTLEPLDRFSLFGYISWASAILRTAREEMK